MLKPNPMQLHLAAKYEDGEFQGLADPTDAGDGLFTFLWQELSDQEDCDSWEEAQRRLLSVMRQVNELYTKMFPAGTPLEMLNYLIEIGVEYPTAEYRVTQAFPISSDELRAAYDAQP